MKMEKKLLTKSEMKAHLEECFAGYSVVMEKRSYYQNSHCFRIRRLTQDIPSHDIRAYSYSLSESERMAWYLSFYNSNFNDGVEVALFEGTTLYYKEQYEELMRLEHLTKQAIHRILNMEKDPAGLRDWKLRQIN